MEWGWQGGWITPNLLMGDHFPLNSHSMFSFWKNFSSACLFQRDSLSCHYHFNKSCSHWSTPSLIVWLSSSGISDAGRSLDTAPQWACRTWWIHILCQGVLYKRRVMVDQESSFEREAVRIFGIIGLINELLVEINWRVCKWMPVSW